MKGSGIESRIGRLLAAAGAVAMLAGRPALAHTAQDDLQVVKRAVHASVQAPAPEKVRPPAEAEPGPRQARPSLPGSDLKWLRVRVVPKTGSKTGRVSVNFPLGLVRALGEDWPIPAPGCHHHDRCRVTLGEILRTLDSGQPLVDIEDDEASVRVWVE
jgi:hypothetical protein